MGFADRRFFFLHYGWRHSTCWSFPHGRFFLYIRSFEFFFISLHLSRLSCVSVGLGHLHYDSALSFVLGAGFFFSLHCLFPL